jgi:hypothetical protein
MFLIKNHRLKNTRKKFTRVPEKIIARDIHGKEVNILQFIGKQHSSTNVVVFAMFLSLTKAMIPTIWSKGRTLYRV